MAKPRKPEGAVESFQLSKGQRKGIIAALVFAVIAGLSHMYSTEESAVEVEKGATSTATKTTSGAVQHLSDASWDSFLASNMDGALVNFHSPNCGFCAKLEPHFAAAAKELKSSGPALASIDSEHGANVMMAQNISRYPSVYWFWKGQQVLELKRASEKSKDEIVQWARWAATPAVQELETQAEFDGALATLRQTLHSKGRLIIGFNRADSTELRESLEAAAQRLRATTVFLWIKEVTTGQPLIKSFGQEESNDETYEAKPTESDVVQWVSGILEKAKPPKENTENAEGPKKSAADLALEQLQKANAGVA